MAAEYDGKAVATAAAVKMGDLTVSYQAQLALAAGNRQVTMALMGVKPGDVLSARPISAIPDGYDIGQAFCATADQITVVINHPALTLLQTFTVQVRVFKIMS